MRIGPGSSVGALAAKSSAVRDVFEKYEIDYYCRGQCSLDYACAHAGVPLERVASDVDVAAEEPTDRGTDWSTAPLRELIQHIVATHHEFLKHELPKTSHHIKAAVESRHAHPSPVLGALQRVFVGFARELDLHMQKEEAVLFPIVERLESAAAVGAPLPRLPFGAIGNPIGVMEAEHAQCDQELREMRKLIRDCESSDVPRPEVAMLTAALRSLELDLHCHMHLENNILFPRAIALEPKAPPRSK